MRRALLVLLGLVILYALGVVWSYYSVPDQFESSNFVSIHEVVPIGESAATVRLVRAAVEAVDQEAKAGGFSKRDAHAKPHGCVSATFTVVGDGVLRDREHFRQGIFKRPGHKYDAWLRFSNGTQSDDREPDARGVGIKVLGVTEWDLHADLQRSLKPVLKKWDREQEVTDSKEGQELKNRRKELLKKWARQSIKIPDAPLGERLADFLKQEALKLRLARNEKQLKERMRTFVETGTKALRNERWDGVWSLDTDAFEERVRERWDFTDGAAPKGEDLQDWVARLIDAEYTPLESFLEGQAEVLSKKRSEELDQALVDFVDAAAEALPLAQAAYGEHDLELSRAEGFLEAWQAAPKTLSATKRRKLEEKSQRLDSALAALASSRKQQGNIEEERRTIEQKKLAIEEDKREIEREIAAEQERRTSVGIPLKCWTESGELNPKTRHACKCWRPEGTKGEDMATCHEKTEDPAAPINQDFNMINYPAFFLADVMAYEDFFGYQVQHNPIPYFLSWNPLEWKTRGLVNAARNILAKVGNPLDATYYTMTAFKLGPHNVKYSVKPVACEATGDNALGAKAEIPKDAGPHFLRNALVAEVSTHEQCFDFQAQLQDPTSNMPIEDPTVIWDEGLSPYVTLARIEIPKQHMNSDNAEREPFCEQLSISPWNGVTAHRPLGGLNRVRRVVYDAVSTRRHNRNGFRRQEPSGLCMEYIEASGDVSGAWSAKPCPEKLANKRGAQ